VTATVYPSDRNLDLSDQDYFRALQGSASGLFIGAIPSRRSGRPLFTLAQRRETPTGEFDGVIVVGVSPDYFRNFYSKLVDNTQDFAAGLYRDDGAPLARYPEMVWRGSQPVAPTLLLEGIARNPNGGIVVGASAFDGQVKMVSYKRVEGYPLYATLGRTRDSVLRGWRDVMIVELYFGGLQYWGWCCCRCSPGAAPGASRTRWPRRATRWPGVKLPKRNCDKRRRWMQ
jgi:hypothetical protein